MITPAGREQSRRGMPPTKPAKPTKNAESVICSASHPTATWYIQNAELVASVPRRSSRNAGYTCHDYSMPPASDGEPTNTEAGR